jgi:uncharacterized membrane protein
MKLSKAGYSILALLIIHLAGALVIGFQVEPDVVNLSWLNLLISGAIVLANNTEEHSKFYLFSIVVFVAGLSVEILGVATGFPFGSYYYGNALGWKIFEVPIVLGINWWILVYASIHLSIFITKNKIVSMFLAPALMLGMDALIEPLCSKLDFWYWEGNEVPMENYLSWYVISFVLIALYFLNFETKKINFVAIGAFLVQILFFALLNLLL